MTTEIDPFAAMMRKLGALAELDDLDRQAIRGLPSTAEAVYPGRHLVREGTAPRDCCLLVSGHACRYKVSANGRRQIVSFHIAGDLLDLQHLHLSIADHDVQTITAADVVWIPKTNLRTLARQRPAIAEAFWRDTLIDASIFREWVLNVGRRDARSRVAHMLCEFVARCSAAGLGRPEGFVWPMTQEQIGDATGLTAVHVNRMMKGLSAEGAVERQPRGHAVRDWTRLKQIGEFDQAYLHAAASPGLSRVISA